MSTGEAAPGPGGHVRALDDVPVVRSVDRAVVAMDILAREGWLGVTEIAHELGIHKSTVFRMLVTLERRGLVEQDRATQKYRLGFGMLRLAASVRPSLDLIDAARARCEQLSLQTGETVNLAVREGREVVNIHQVNLSSSRVSADWLGSHTDLHCTSSGKVLLAHAPPVILDELLRGELRRRTPATITDPGALRRELAVVRADGYATTLGELEEGLHAVAAPIVGRDESVVAAVSVSGPSYRLDNGRLATVAALTVEATAQISRRLGFVGILPTTAAADDDRGGAITEAVRRR